MSKPVNYIVNLDGEGAYKPYGAIKELWHSKHPEVIVSGPYEALRLDEKIPTPAGWTTMENIQVGDQVFTPDGSRANVVSKTEPALRSTYAVTFHDQSTIYADADHRWLIERRNPSQNWVEEEVTTFDLLSIQIEQGFRNKRGVRQVRIMPADPVHYPATSVPVHPYIMGLFLSEGSSRGDCPMFSTGDEEVVERLHSQLDIIKRNQYDYAANVTRSDRNSVLWRAIKELGLHGLYSQEKFIPAIYLMNSIPMRMELIKGMMDGDGFVNRLSPSTARYSTSSDRLADDMTSLLESVGAIVTRRTRRVRGSTTTSHELSIRHPDPASLFSLSRKREVCRKPQIKPYRYLDSVEVGRPGYVACITVDHPSHLFLADHYIPTGNCGKTFGALQKLHTAATKYPKAQILMARKSYASLKLSAWQSYVNKVLPFPPEHRDCPVSVFGGGNPEHVTYPNGSKIFLGGMDNAEKVLSSEYDMIFIPQGEELLLHDYEQLTSRCTGRAGNMPYSQIIVDCNPGPPSHWILHRKPALLLWAQHKDNPTLWNHDKGEWTEQGKKTIERLQGLTGLRYKRGYLGLWAGAEGQVYEDFDEAIHVIDRFEIPRHWRKYRVMDFGYTHPTVVQWWAQNDMGQLFMYREIYKSRRTIADHIRGVDGVPGIQELSANELYELPMICDHDAEDRAILEQAGIRNMKAKKAIKPGIEAVQDRLRPGKNGDPGVFFLRDSLVEYDEELGLQFRPTKTVDEFPGYVWRELQEGKEAMMKDEVPVKADDHGLDALRYLIMELDGGNTGGAVSVPY